MLEDLGGPQCCLGCTKKGCGLLCPPSVSHGVCATMATPAPGMERDGCTCWGLAGRVCAPEMSWQPWRCRNPVYTGVRGASLGVWGHLCVPDRAACVGVQDVSLLRLLCCAAEGVRAVKSLFTSSGVGSPKLLPTRLPSCSLAVSARSALSYLAAKAEERLIPLAPDLFGVISVPDLVLDMLSSGVARSPRAEPVTHREVSHHREGQGLLKNPGRPMQDLVGVGGLGSSG